MLEEVAGLNEFALRNIVLSVVTGGLIGLWWTMKMKRPRAWWSIALTAVFLALSIWILGAACLVCVDSTGIYARLFVSSLVAVILIGALARWARQYNICFNTHPQ